MNDTLSSIVAQLKQDYKQFPNNQTYELYTENVHFKDPLNEFDGLDRYREMIGFLDRFFHDIQMELHSIEETSSDLITTQWTLNMTAPLPWSPSLSIPGRSELGIDPSGLIRSHVDYWHCSKLAVFSASIQSVSIQSVSIQSIDTQGIDTQSIHIPIICVSA